MPVYLITIHTYRSWREDHPRGYVQRGAGLQISDPVRAAWRKEHATHPPRRLTKAQQLTIHHALKSQIDDDVITLHAASTTPTHVHSLISFQSPACSCGPSRPYCLQHCPARQRAEQCITRLKRQLGRALTQHDRERDPTPQRRKWFSRGWDLTAIRNRKHFDYLIDNYLPKHESEGGIVHIYHA